MAFAFSWIKEFLALARGGEEVELRGVSLTDLSLIPSLVGRAFVGIIDEIVTGCRPG